MRDKIIRRSDKIDKRIKRLSMTTKGETKVDKVAVKVTAAVIAKVAGSPKVVGLRKVRMGVGIRTDGRIMTRKERTAKVNLGTPLSRVRGMQHNNLGMVVRILKVGMATKVPLLARPRGSKRKGGSQASPLRKVALLASGAAATTTHPNNARFGFKASNSNNRLRKDNSSNSSSKVRPLSVLVT